MPIEKKRSYHVTFYLNCNLYLTGGIDKWLNFLDGCESYDVKEEQWIDSIHKLPFALKGSVASTSRDGSFAILTGEGKRNGLYNKLIITFIKTDGFKILANISMRFERFRGVSVVI